MAKRLLTAILIATAMVACASTDGDGGGGTSKIDNGNTATARMGESGVESAIRALGIDGAVATLDLNQANYPQGPVRVARLHMLRNYVLAEGSKEKPRVFGIQRANLNAKWISQLPEPSAFEVGETGDSALFLSDHYLTPLELLDGRRTFRLAGTEVRGPPKALPFTPTAGAAGIPSTAYIPSLGSSVNNKKLESTSLYTGQRGWGWRALGDVLTRPLVGGSSGDPRLYFVTNTGIVTSLDARNYGFGPRDPRWERRLKSGVAEGHQPCLTADTEEIVGAYYVVDRKGTIYCIDRITGRFRWTNPTGETPVGGPTVFGDVCVVPMRSGLIAYDKQNVVYRIDVVSGPSKGESAVLRAGAPLRAGRGSDLNVNDPRVAPGHLTFRVQGEVLTVRTAEDAQMRVDGVDIGSRGAVEHGAEIAIGGSVLRISDIGQQPLWRGLPYDRVVVRIADTLVVARGNTLQAIDAYSGEPTSDAVDIPGVRLVPANPHDSTLVVLAGNATLYALYPR